MDVERAVGLEVRAQRDRGEPAEAVVRRRMARDARVVGQAPDHDRLPGHRHLPREDFAELQAIEVARDLLRQPLVDDEVELLTRFVEQIHPAGLGLDDLEHLVERVREHLVEARKAADGQGHRVDRGERVGADVHRVQVVAAAVDRRVR